MSNYLSKEEAAAARQQILATFNPNENGLSAHGIFGMPFTPDEAQIVLLPVPWEVTVSYGEGTANGPEAILKASHQIDLYDPIYPNGWKAGIAMAPISERWKEANDSLRAHTVLYIHELTANAGVSPQANEMLAQANQATLDLRHWVKHKAEALLDAGRFVGIVGGEHSVPLGYMEALAERHPGYGILQIDAHADLRVAYEGFMYSHASIMYNAMQIPGIGKLVQVGIRDFSHQECEQVNISNGRIQMFTDHEIKNALYGGRSWHDIADDIVKQLPKEVYISFDIDGLQPWLCPNTGTPVPGGMLVEEAMYLIKRVIASGCRIIGFDLCEVAPGHDEWDGNVGARVLYKLCMLLAKSNNLG